MTTNQATGKIKASRVNNLDAATYIGPDGQIWYDVATGVLRLGDNVTPGGTIIGGGSGNGVPGGPIDSIQFNAGGGFFGGTTGLTFNATTNALTIGGSITANGNVTGNYFVGNGVSITGPINATGNVSGNALIGNTVSATGNITGNYFIGNGSQLTGINVSSNAIFNGTSNVSIATANGNVTVDVNGTSNVAVFTDTGLDVAGNINATDTVDANLVIAENALFLNANVVVANYTIPPGYNAISSGPITIPDGIVVDSVSSNWGIV